MEIVIALVAVFLVGILALPRTAGGSTAPDGSTGALDLDPIIRKYAYMRNVPFNILKAMIWQESRFNSLAVNDERLKNDPSDDARGLMQIRAGALADFNQATGNSYSVQHLFNADININVGSWYLGQLIRRNGIETGVQMYNTGEQGYKNGVRNAAYASAIMTRSAQYA